MIKITGRGIRAFRIGIWRLAAFRLGAWLISRGESLQARALGDAPIREPAWQAQAAAAGSPRPARP